MFGVFPLEFLFDARIVFFPEAREVPGYLDRPLTRRKNLDHEGNSFHRNTDCSLDAVQVLDGLGNGRLPILFQ